MAKNSRPSDKWTPAVGSAVWDKRLQAWVPIRKGYWTRQREMAARVRKEASAALLRPPRPRFEVDGDDEHSKLNPRGLVTALETK